jgi:hypothetical protein
METYGEIFTCNICNYECQNLSLYLSHVCMHSQNANAIFKCPKSNCIMQYKSFNVFRSHCHKTHQDKFQVLNKNFNICAPEKTFRCKYEVCNKLFVRANDIYSHTLEHLDERITIICPLMIVQRNFLLKIPYWKQNSNIVGTHPHITEEFWNQKLIALKIIWLWKILIILKLRRIMIAKMII